MNRDEISAIADSLGFPVLQLDAPGWLHYSNTDNDRLLLNKRTGGLFYYHAPDNQRLVLANDVRNCHVEDLAGQLNGIRSALKIAAKRENLRD